MDFVAFKEQCAKENIKMTSFESMMEFSEFHLNEEGLLPVIAQSYKTGEVLMFSYMDKEAFYNTIKTGKMTYYDREAKRSKVQGRKAAIISM